MNNISPMLRSSDRGQTLSSKGLALGLTVLLLASQSTLWFWGILLAIGLWAVLSPTYPFSVYPWFRALSRWQTIGVLVGLLLFASIITHADPAMAQLFKNVEDQTQSTFGTYIDQGIITFLFNMMRIVIWVAAVGFVFFAVYQAQRGEQWQPLLQNAFIIIAAVVVVEGLSKLFFGTA